MNSGFAYDWELRGAARSAPEGKTLQAAALFSQRSARAWRFDWELRGAARSAPEGKKLQAAAQFS